MNGVFLSLTLGRPSSKVGEGTLTPPTVAPVLTVSADFGSYIAVLEWTASNKTDSAGFSYSAQYSSDGVNFVEFYNGTGLTTNFSIGLGEEGLYYFKVIPLNDAGNGPDSNTASVILPGVI